MLPEAALRSNHPRTWMRCPPRLLRLLFSWPTAIASMLIMLMVLTVRDRFKDPDTWWHLKSGEIIWKTHHIPTVDLFSYTTGNAAYVPHEWLAQLSIYGAYEFWGYSGMMLWLCGWGAALLVGGYLLCSLYCGNPKVAFLGALTIWLFSTIGVSIRPQMIGYSLLVCELLLLHLGAARNSRWFFALPALFALWVNCHGSFMLGIVVGAIWLGCSFIDLRLGLLVSDRLSPSARRRLAVSLCVSVAALFINPTGWHQVAYPFNTLFHQTLQMRIISEWQPLDMGTSRGMAVLAVAGLILALPMLRGVRLRLYELVTLALSVWLAVHHTRMMFAFGVLAAPILCRLLADAWENYEFSRDRIAPNLVCTALAMAATVFGFPSKALLVEQVNRSNPVAAVRFMREAGLADNVLNDYLYGGYLIWAAPNKKVFVDGRGDVFEWTGLLAEYADWMTLRTDPAILLDKYHVGVCLLPADSVMSDVLARWLGWKVAYRDAVAVVLVKNSLSVSAATASGSIASGSGKQL